MMVIWLERIGSVDKGCALALRLCCAYPAGLAGFPCDVSAAPQKKSVKAAAENRELDVRSMPQALTGPAPRLQAIRIPPRGAFTSAMPKHYLFPRGCANHRQPVYRLVGGYLSASAAVLSVCPPLFLSCWLPDLTLQSAPTLF